MARTAFLVGRLAAVVPALGLVMLAGDHGVFSDAPQSHEKPTTWRADFAEAQSEARDTGRPLLVHFHAEWCGPCRKMEREVLGTPDLARQIDGRFVAVKVDADRSAELLETFGVLSLPCDLFLSPEGKVLARSEGYRDRAGYLKQIARVDAEFARDQQVRLAKQSRSTADADDGDEAAEQRGSPSSPAAEPEPPIGLEGHSPVALWHHRQWVKGQPRFAWKHQGVVYQMSDAAERSAFQRNPGRYAPRLLGCDPVVMADTDRALPGRLEHAAFFRGELYLFVSAESRDRFHRHPQRYTRTRHVLRDDEFNARRWR